MRVSKYDNIPTLIEDFKKEGRITENDKQLYVIFDDWTKNRLFDTWLVKMVSFGVIHNNGKSSAFNFRRFCLSPEESVRWIDVSNQLTNELSKMKRKKPHKLIIDLNNGDYPMKIN